MCEEKILLTSGGRGELLEAAHFGQKQTLDASGIRLKNRAEKYSKLSALGEDAPSPTKKLFYILGWGKKGKELEKVDKMRRLLNAI